MKEQANDVFEICSYVDGLEKKIDSMTEELTNMQNQIKEMQEDTLVNNAKKVLSEAQERLNARCEQIKSQLSEVKEQVKSTAKGIVEEAKEKGRAALYRVSEFLGIKKRFLDIRENVRGAIKTTDKNKKRYDKYKKFDVVYADFGRNPHGVQGGIRPGIVVSCDASNHGGAPQISVVPLSSKLKDNPVHVIVEPSEIRGHALSNRSDFMPEDIQTLNKGCVRFKSGYIPGESEIREAMDRAMIMQLNLLPVARKMVLEELEMKQNG